MISLGIDIGTTSISAAVLDGKKELESLSVPNTAAVSGLPYERLQSPQIITDIVFRLAEELCAKYKINSIGLTGQMHGIICTDKAGNAVSPLYTWQDQRGGIDDFYRSLDVGTNTAPGFGLVTYLYNKAHGLNDKSAARITTIGSYIAMKLCRLDQPYLHISDAHSLGGFDIGTLIFTEKAQALAGDVLPELKDGVIGEYRGIPVSVSVGDNQASFLAAAGTEEGRTLINIGTGAQLSVCIKKPITCEGLEVRPLLRNSYLLNGSPLCGGRSYAIIERFIRSCLEECGYPAEGKLYSILNQLAEKEQDDLPVTDTRFCGTRQQPELRGCIANISDTNLTCSSLVRSTLIGMAEELYGYYTLALPHIANKPSAANASGNAVKRNLALQRILENRFALPLRLSPYGEDAAAGAALYSAMNL